MIELVCPDKAKVKRSFAVAAGSYDGLAALQRKVGLELLERFPLADRSGVWLDVGCGTGFLTNQLAIRTMGEPLIALDIALPMLHACRRNYPNLIARHLCADAENLPFASASIDSIYSNLALQWAQDLPKTLKGFRRVLKGNGQLVFATFGPATLHELKAAWAAVDDFVHVNHFHAADDIRRFLWAAGFESIDVDSSLYRSCYPSVQALMRELKGIGAHNVNHGRNPKPTTKGRLAQMMSEYRRLMTGTDIVASYEIIFVQAGLS